MKTLLHLAYDGTGYHGWQSQPSGRGVQDQVERALFGILRENIRVEGASRTDTGVHAHDMPAHFESRQMPVPPARLPVALNHFLPADIRVTRAESVSDAFHARHDATGKTYSYTLWNHPAHHPLRRHDSWHVPQQLDLAAMRAAAAQLTGTHDFRAFTVTCPGELKNPITTLRRLGFQGDGPALHITLEGDRFLYKMCRALVGLLVQVGTGKGGPSDVARLLEPEKLPPEARSGLIAPPHGLALWHVSYPSAWLPSA
ncbi:tRNA pseudouridine(38-40) synthase TruA [Haloferula sargassicola]|uniref:tRNA pseudouridine synthase A n=1 Tax=Haloferula sargassicola TaxID=490096 RepID=A0ABP9UQ79_9BACT